MKTRKMAGSLAALAAAILLGPGCGPADDQTVEPVGEEIRIEITGDDRLRFDPTEFDVGPRQPVTINFRNVGTMPKESMGHNVVVLRLGTDAIAFATAGAPHARNQHVPPEMEDRVIASTRILGPGESEEISFVAPSQAGAYDYICSFPGHTQAGMRGVMNVREQ